MRKRRRNVIWTPLMEEYMYVKRLRGDSFREIGSAIGVSDKTAANRFRAVFPDFVKPRVRHVPTRREHSAETRAEVVRLRQEGMTLRQIGNTLGLRVMQVNGIWAHWRGRKQDRREAA